MAWGIGRSKDVVSSGDDPSLTSNTPQIPQIPGTDHFVLKKEASWGLPQLHYHQGRKNDYGFWERPCKRASSSTGQGRARARIRPNKRKSTKATTTAVRAKAGWTYLFDVIWRLGRWRPLGLGQGQGQDVDAITG